MSRIMLLAAASALALAPAAPAAPDATGACGAGAITIFHLEDHKIVPSTDYAESLFGRSLALDGDRFVVGAPYANAYGITDIGRCKVYRREGGTWPWMFAASWAEEDSFTGGTSYDKHGYAVEVDANGSARRIIVGQPGASSNTGLAKVYLFNGIDWVQEGADLIDPSGSAYDWFGAAVAIDGDTAVVGAPSYDNARGAIFVFERSGSDWGEPVETFTGANELDRFGYSVDIKGDYIAVGAPEADYGGIDETGFAYAYYRNSSGDWAYLQELEWDPLEPWSYYENMHFGEDVAIGESTLIVGMPGEPYHHGVEGAGAAYVFELVTYPSISYWVVDRVLLASDGEGDDHFGERVAISEGLIAIGAPGCEIDVGGTTLTEAGVVYVFETSGTTEIGRIDQPDADAESGNEFGYDLDADGWRLAVGTRHDTYFPLYLNEGSAYIYGAWRAIGFEAMPLPLPSPECSGTVLDWAGGPMAVGWVDTEIVEAFVWTETGPGTWTGSPLPTLGYGGQANAMALGGQIGDEIIAGEVLTAQGTPHAAHWNDLILGLLPMPATGTESTATCAFLEDFVDPVVAGHATLVDGQHGVLWDRPAGQWQSAVLPNLDGGSMGRVNDFVIQPDPDSFRILVGQCRNANGVMRPVRWQQDVGGVWEILPMPMLPGGGPAGAANAIVQHVDGSMVILGEAQSAEGPLVPAQWKLIIDTWVPMTLSPELDPPLSGLRPLAMAEGPWPGSIVGFGRNVQNQPRGVLWAPDYSGGKLYNLSTLIGNSIPASVREAVAMTQDGRIAANLVSTGDSGAAPYPVILYPIEEVEPEPCPADINDDGTVDVQDLLQLLSAWGNTSGPEDINGDGIVDVQDLLQLLSAWGPCP